MSRRDLSQASFVDAMVSGDGAEEEKVQRKRSAPPFLESQDG